MTNSWKTWTKLALIGIGLSTAMGFVACSAQPRAVNQPLPATVSVTPQLPMTVPAPTPPPTGGQDAVLSENQFAANLTVVGWHVLDENQAYATAIKMCRSHLFTLGSLQDMALTIRPGATPVMQRVFAQSVLATC